MTETALPALDFGVITMAVLFGVVQAGFIIYFLLLKNRYRQHIWLMATVSTLIIMMLEAFMLRSGLVARYPHIFNISIPFVFLLGPCTLLYIRSQFGLSKSRWSFLHFLPFAFYAIYSFNFFLQPAAYKRAIYMFSFHPDAGVQPIPSSFYVDPWAIQGWVVVELLSLHILLYALIGFFTIAKRRRSNKKVMPEKIRWTSFTAAILALGALILFFSQGGVIRGEVFFKSPFPHYSADLYSMIATYLITGYMITRIEQFKNGARKYAKSSLSNDFMKEKSAQLTRLIEDQQLYLSPDFSMKTLSRDSGLSVHHISQILNEELKCTFFELTNGYRIEAAKQRLSETEGFVKMEQLAYDLGYRSKSTFFGAFKKATGTTPSKYRNESLV